MMPRAITGEGQPLKNLGTDLRSVRKGEEKSFSLTLGEVPQAREARAASPDSDAAGASLPKLGL